MFRCDSCKKVSLPREKPHKVVIDTRVRELDGGEEIVKEINQCESCFDLNKTEILKRVRLPRIRSPILLTEISELKKTLWEEGRGNE